MSLTASTQNQTDKFELQITGFKSSSSMEKACEIIYGKSDRKLVASLGSLPYVVGRSFYREEIEALRGKLQSAGVSFKLVGKPPLTEVISYNANQPESAAPESSAPRLNNSLVVTLVVVLVLVLLSLYVAQNRESDSALPPTTSGADSISPRSTPETPTELVGSTNESFDAILTQVRGNISHRKRDSLFWSPASERAELLQRDSLRSFDHSSAVLLYRSGTRVLIQPNTFVVVGATTETDGVEKREISLNEGGVNARLTHSEKPQELSIRTTQGRVRITSPAAGEQPVSLFTQVIDGQTRVAVAQGSLSFEPHGEEREPVRLTSAQQISASNDRISAPTPYRSEIELSFPPNNSQIRSTESEETPFEFRWNPLLGENIVYRWRLSADQNMTDILLSQEVSDSEIKLTYLDPGTLYWQVSADVDGIQHRSPIHRIYVQQRND